MKILLAGDIHIGRSSSRMPASVPRRELRAVRAWDRLVDLAIAQQADLLLLSGDIADQENRFWEAIGPLEAGVSRLAAAGVQTIAVAGNHDFDVLARLARQFPEGEAFRLLGEGGKWERHTLTREGSPVLHVDGWSFPHHHVYHDPFESYDLPADHACPTIGLVHGDIYDTASPYAPIDLPRLQARATGPWLLGHIHAPRLIDNVRHWILYPGSLQALDPGEPGPRGCWVTHLRQGAFSPPRQVQVSSAWYESLTITIDAVESGDDLDDQLLGPLRRLLAKVADGKSDDETGQSEGDARDDGRGGCGGGGGGGGGMVRGVCARVTLTGESPLAAEIEPLARRITGDLALRHGEATLGVDRLEVDVLPPLDLAELSRSHAPPGALARLLLQLERSAGSPPPDADAAPDPALELLFADARKRIAAFDGRRAFVELDKNPPDDGAVRRYVAHEARVLLRHLTAEDA